jgi:hypothetical protein
MRVLLFALLALAAGRAAADVNDVINERRLSIPASPVSVTFAREDWLLSQEQRRPGDTAVYYLHSSPKRSLVFSVYIDKTDACTSAESCLEASLKNPAYKDAQELQRATEGAFRYVRFYLDNPKGLQVKQAHVLASAYLQGTWVDVHLSSTGKERPDLAALEAFLKALIVK